VYLEHVLARAVLRAISNGHKWSPLPVKPVILGCAGTPDSPYKNSAVRVLTAEGLHRLKGYLNRR